MRRIIILSIFSIFLMAAVPAMLADQQVDSKSSMSGQGQCEVIVRFNGGGENNKVFIGEKNVLEIWIANPAVLQSTSMGFGIITDADGYSIVTGYGDVDGTAKGTKGIIKDHAGAAKAFNMGGVLVNDTGLPHQILIGGVSTPGPQFPASDEPRLVYTIQIEIPADAQPAKNGFCIDNIYVPPGGTWEFNDGTNEIIPLFNGHENKSTRQPSAPSACFELVKR